VRDSCEEGDDYAEGYAAGETHQRSYLRGIELVEEKRYRTHPRLHMRHYYVIITYIN